MSDNETEAQKHPGGRPTDYLPEYCASVVEWGKQGKSKAWMCAELDIVDQTMRNWGEAHPEFLEAITRGLKHSQKWWEDKGQDNLETTGFQSSMWSRSMAARFPDDWREKSSTELSGPNQGPIQHEDVSAISLIESRIDSIVARKRAEGSAEGAK